MTKMKDSGIEWIGEIPEGWKVKRNRGLFVEVNDRCDNGNDYTLLSVSEYTGITPRIDVIKNGEFETHAATLDGYKICQSGDIVMNIMLAWKRATAMSAYDGIVSPAYCVYRGKGINTKYYHYLFRTDRCADMFKRYSTGIIDSRLRLYPNIFLSLFSIVPPISEQNRISSYLDTQCAKIDAVLEQTRNSIEEYKKLKQAVITQAVTKGIRPRRKMKDSGNKRWGEIPDDWTLVRVKNCVSSVTSGLSAVTDDAESEESGKYVLRTSSVSTGVFIPSEVKAVLESAANRLVCPVEKGTLIVSRMNTSKMVGACAYVDCDCPNTYLPDKLWKIAIKNDSYPKYFWFALNSIPARSWFAEISTGASASMQNISISDFTSNTIPLPPVGEQHEIANYLENKSIKIENAIEKKHRFLTELESYKKSLIYECVTGKREV